MRISSNPCPRYSSVGFRDFSSTAQSVPLSNNNEVSVDVRLVNAGSTLSKGRKALVGRGGMNGRRDGITGTDFTNTGIVGISSERTEVPRSLGVSVHQGGATGLAITY